jgi:hypothetical protein
MTAGIPEIELKHLYRLEATVGENLDIGRGPYGYRRCIGVSGGTFQGERLRGEVL